MYFENRYRAGEQLAQILYDNYRYEDCAILALNDGGVLVAEPIAAALHTFLMMLITESIDVPGEGLVFGSVSQTGSFTYDSNLSIYEQTEYTNEFSSYLQEKKREAFQKINRLLGDGGITDLTMLNDRNIILVSDGFDKRFSVAAVLDFLKPVRVRRLVAVSPVACSNMINKLHVSVDEIHILDIKANYMGTNHYYDDNAIPDHEVIVQKINQNILNWQ